jgi:uncharacterized repeat protein (TIGR02543 family)
MKTQDLQVVKHHGKIKTGVGDMKKAALLRSDKKDNCIVFMWFVFLLLLLSAIPTVSHSAPTKWLKLLSPDIAEKVERKQPVEVLILLEDADERLMEEAADKNLEKLHLAAAPEYNKRMQKRKNLLNTLKVRVKSELADPDLEVKTDYSVLPIMHVRINSARALDKLIKNQKVLSIDENRPNTTFLAQSLPLIGRTDSQVSGYIGAGTTVAVLDTGVNYTHAAFGSCSTPGGNCKVAYAQDFASSDGQLDDNGHGTNVAAIVLGVAPGAKIAALDVFRTDGYAYSSDIINAINWCITNKTTYNLASINMSLGGGRYYSPVDPYDSWGTAIQRAINAGILVSAASGNATYTDSMGTPAAYSNVVSVGAVYDANLGGVDWSDCTDYSTFADKVTCFSNSASYLTLLAPGAIIDAAGISMGGTSQAAPHVAGAAAVLRAAYPDDSVSQTVARLKQGKSVTDPRNGVVTPRVDFVTALGNSSDYTLVTSVNPTGTGTISPENGTYSPGTVVTLTATSNSGYAFTGWGGDCSGSVNTCNVLMDKNKTVTADFTSIVNPLTNGIVAGNLSDTVDNLKHFYLDVPSGMTSLTFKTYGGTGDVDLYTKLGSLPTTTDYDCRPNLNGNTETCTITNPTAGRYYATLYAYSAYSGVNLLASYVAGSSSQTVQMSAAGYSIPEGGGQIIIPVYRQGGTTGEVTVKYTTANGTARSGSDYKSKQGTLSWSAGDSSSRNIVVPIINDKKKEAGETFRVNLSGITGATLGTNKTATVTIIDND